MTEETYEKFKKILKNKTNDEKFKILAIILIELLKTTTNKFLKDFDEYIEDGHAQANIIMSAYISGMWNTLNNMIDENDIEVKDAFKNLQDDVFNALKNNPMLQSIKR